MVLHADHHYGSAIGQKPSLMSSVSATTWDSTRVRKPLFTPEMMEKIINKAKKQKSTGGLLAMGRGEDTDKLVEQELKQMDSMLGRSTIGQRLARACAPLMLYAP